jgi:hypothetical protein
VPFYHFLYVPPALGADWLLVAARRYWELFRPIVIDKLDLIDYTPPDTDIALTIVARRDMAAQVVDEVAKRFPHIRLDPLVYDVPADLQLTLDGRATYQQRFGIPESPTPTATPATEGS